MNALAETGARAATWRLWVAPIVWAVHFLAIYGFTALACARSGSGGWFGPEVVPWFVFGATLVAAVVLAMTIVAAVRDGRRVVAAPAAAGFVPWLTAALAGLVLLAVLWETLPVLLVPVCA